MGWLQVFLSLLLKLDVGETFPTFLFPEDLLGCRESCQTHSSRREPRQDFVTSAVAWSGLH